MEENERIVERGRTTVGRTVLIQLFSIAYILYCHRNFWPSFIQKDEQTSWRSEWRQSGGHRVVSCALKPQIILQSHPRARLLSNKIEQKKNKSTYTYI